MGGERGRYVLYDLSMVHYSPSLTPVGSGNSPKQKSGLPGRHGVQSRCHSRRLSSCVFAPCQSHMNDPPGLYYSMQGCLRRVMGWGFPHAGSGFVFRHPDLACAAPPPLLQLSQRLHRALPLRCCLRCRRSMTSCLGGDCEGSVIESMDSYNLPREPGHLGNFGEI